MSSTTFRTYATATTAAALLGAASFLAPAAAMAAPLAPSDIIKIDSPELTVKVNGDTAQFTVTAPEDMACVGPLIVEGSIDADDIDPENINEAFFEDLFDEAIWPTEEKDLHAVVNEGSPLAGGVGQPAQRQRARTQRRRVRRHVAVCDRGQHQHHHGSRPAQHVRGYRLPGADPPAQLLCHHHRQREPGKRRRLRQPRQHGKLTS